jgi:hypothetical protein
MGDIASSVTDGIRGESVAMGRWSDEVRKLAALRTIHPELDRHYVPRGKAICKKLKTHDWGTLEKWGPGRDGAMGWQMYRGCKRCGVAQ